MNHDELRAALDAILTVDALGELAAVARGTRTLGEVAARLDGEAVRSERAAEGYVSHGWHREAETERTRAEGFRRRAAALRVLVGASS